MTTKHEQPSYSSARRLRSWPVASILHSHLDRRAQKNPPGWTYVFPTRESGIALGKMQAGPDESVDLTYSRLSHPNAEILEDQILPLEPEAEAATVFFAFSQRNATTGDE